MNKKAKTLIVASALIATSLGFALPWFENQMRYEEYLKTVEKDYINKYGAKLTDLSEKKLGEAGQMSERNLAMTICLNRYRKENHSFAPALTACKQELLFDLSGDADGATN